MGDPEDSQLDVLPEVSIDDFVRRFGNRSSSLMWLLGAGASASAGIPTAWNMIWDFKQRLYVTQQKAHPKSVADLSNPSIRARLQQHIRESGEFPKEGANDEYAALFEAVFPSESDRRTYIDEKIRGGKPSYGHMALATLMKADRARIIWTTNFDPLVADACAAVFESTADLTDIGLDAPALGSEVLSDERWPVQIKLHGDFRSSKLKNTSTELRGQDATMRKMLVDACRRYGLIIVGYSGRDDSIMDTLEEVLQCDSPFPAGLFWLNRGTPPPRVGAFLQKAAQQGVDGGLVVVHNFDETLQDLIRPLDGLDEDKLSEFTASRSVRTAAPEITGIGASPLLRLNALPLESYPNICRLVRCSIGGVSDVKDAIRETGAKVIGSRRNTGVIAFGDDKQMHKAFAEHNIEELDVHTIHVGKLRFDSQERGLISEAIATALSRKHGLRLNRRRSQYFLSPVDTSHEQWRQLSKLVGKLEGYLPKHSEVKWNEGVGIKLDWASERLWLLIEPRIVFDGLTANTRHAASDFARERTVRRYNPDLNALLEFWTKLLASNGESIAALGVTSGLDAEFVLGMRSAYSRRYSL